MPAGKRRSHAALERELASLRLRLEEAEQALVVIRSGGVDAIFVRGEVGEQVFSLRGADHAHRVLLEGLNEAALTLTVEGTILYCNGRFQEMSQISFPRLLGSSLFDVVPSAERSALTTVLTEATKRPTRREFHIRAADASLLPALFSTKVLESEGMRVLCMVITDIADRKRVEEALLQSERHYRALFEEGERLREELQRLSGEVLRAQEEERTRISRDIHDEIGQALTAIRLNLRKLERKAPPGEVQKNLRSVEEIVEKASDFIHTFSHRIHPGMLEDLGLYPAIRSLVRDFEKNSGMRVDLRLLGTAGLATMEQKGALYRIVQESLTNVMKHAGTRSATVTIRKSANAIDLRVVDTGKGFSPGDRAKTNGKRGGLGVVGMRERVRALGGEFSILSRSGKGTRVHVRLPGGGGDRHHE